MCFAALALTHTQPKLTSQHVRQVDLPAEWLLDDGSPLGHNVKFNTQSWQYGQYVTEHYDSIGPERLPGLQGQLNSNFGCLRPMSEAILV